MTSGQIFFAFTYILLLTLVLATPHLASKLEQLELNIASDSEANITTSCEMEFFNFLWLI